MAHRVFTRPPFHPTPVEIPQVADHGGPFLSRPAAVPEPVFGAPSRAHVQPKRARVLPPHLHRRDRSVYAWFESVGFLLGALSVGGACVALVLG